MGQSASFVKPIEWTMGKRYKFDLKHDKNTSERCMFNSLCYTLLKLKLT